MAITQSNFALTQPSKTTPTAHPTWYGEIRYMFTDIDAVHMGNQGLDLTNYDAVRSSASGIYSQVSTGGMPPQNPWPAAWVETFLNWMVDKFPKGTDTLPTNVAAMQLTATANVERIRKDIRTLSTAEIDTLKKAFEGILSKPPNDPNSYFVQAGFHWFPAPTYCLHHVPGYNPWHRGYLLSFENALRSVPGCEAVTLPYWDITTELPDVLKNPPFDKYTLPIDIGGGFAAGYTTQRYPYADINANLKATGVAQDIDNAMSKTSWEEFHGLLGGRPNDAIMRAHDSGHVSIGDTMARPTVAAFDPVFWFFHCNWDRLFWKWQQGMNATTLTGLLTTITDTNSRNIFTIPALQTLNLNPFSSAPLNLTTVDVVDSAGSLKIDYEHPAGALAERKLTATMRSVLVGGTFRVGADHVNVRVAGVQTMQIPGSFIVHLVKDGQIIASRGFFQAAQSERGEHHAMPESVNFDFQLPRDLVDHGKLSVRVEPVDKSFVGPEFPPKMMGNPTIEINLPLHVE